MKKRKLGCPTGGTEPILMCPVFTTGLNEEEEVGCPNRWHGTHSDVTCFSREKRRLFAPGCGVSDISYYPFILFTICIIVADFS